MNKNETLNQEAEMYWHHFADQAVENEQDTTEEIELVTLPNGLIVADIR